MIDGGKAIDAWPADGPTDNSNLIRFRLREVPLLRLKQYADELGLSLGEAARILMLQQLARETRIVKTKDAGAGGGR